MDWYIWIPVGGLVILVFGFCMLLARARAKADAEINSRTSAARKRRSRTWPTTSHRELPRACWHNDFGLKVLAGGASAC